MPGVSRDSIDRAFTGHGCHRFIGVDAGTQSVKANNVAMLKVGDRLKPHTILVCCPPACENHPAVVNRGSPNVFIQNIPVARAKDSADFGFLLTGSFNVFANGGR